MVHSEAFSSAPDGFLQLSLFNLKILLPYFTLLFYSNITLKKYPFDVDLKPIYTCAEPIKDGHHSKSHLA